LLGLFICLTAGSPLVCFVLCWLLVASRCCWQQATGSKKQAPMSRSFCFVLLIVLPITEIIIAMIKINLFALSTTTTNNKSYTASCITTALTALPTTTIIINHSTTTASDYSTTNINI